MLSNIALKHLNGIAAFNRAVSIELAAVDEIAKVAALEGDVADGAPLPGVGQVWLNAQGIHARTQTQHPVNGQPEVCRSHPGALCHAPALKILPMQALWKRAWHDIFKRFWLRNLRDAIDVAHG